MKKTYLIIDVSYRLSPVLGKALKHLVCGHQTYVAANITTLYCPKCKARVTNG